MVDILTQQHDCELNVLVTALTLLSPAATFLGVFRIYVVHVFLFSSFYQWLASTKPTFEQYFHQEQRFARNNELSPKDLCIAITDILFSK